MNPKETLPTNNTPPTPKRNEGEKGKSPSMKLYEKVKDKLSTDFKLKIDRYLSSVFTLKKDPNTGISSPIAIKPNINTRIIIGGIADAIFAQLTELKKELASNDEQGDVKTQRGAHRLASDSVIDTVARTYLPRINTLFINLGVVGFTPDEHMDKNWLIYELDTLQDKYRKSLNLVSSERFEGMANNVARNTQQWDKKFTSYKSALNTYNSSSKGQSDKDLYRERVREIGLGRLLNFARADLYNLYFHKRFNETEMEEVRYNRTLAVKNYREIVLLQARNKTAELPIIADGADLTPAGAGSKIQAIETIMRDIDMSPADPKTQKWNDRVKLNELAQQITSSGLLEMVDGLSEYTRRFHQLFWNKPEFTKYVYTPTPIIAGSGTSTTIHGLSIDNFIKLSDDDLAQIVVESKNKYDRGVEAAEYSLLRIGECISMSTDSRHTRLSPQMISLVNTLDLTYGLGARDMLLALYKLKTYSKKLHVTLNGYPPYTVARNRKISAEHRAKKDAMSEMKSAASPENRPGDLETLIRSGFRPKIARDGQSSE